MMDGWQIFFAFIAACLTILTLFLGLNQYRIASAKLRLDLFERRLAVYQATGVFLVFRQSEKDDHEAKSAEDSFYRQRGMAPFLFPPDIAGYLNELLQRTNELRDLRRRWAARNKADENDDLQRKLSNEEQWLTDQIKSIQGRFAPYLDLATWQATPFFEIRPSKS